MCESEQRQADAYEFVVTPEMVQAGVEALSDSHETSSAYQATAVFEAMLAASALGKHTLPAHSA